MYILLKHCCSVSSSPPLFTDWEEPSGLREVVRALEEDALEDVGMEDVGMVVGVQGSERKGKSLGPFYRPEL